MDALQSMRVFAQVAQVDGFARAARALRLSPAQVSKHVAALEARVGARLFDRTTRHVALTEIGRLYLERCLECLQAFDDADAAVSELTRDPAGVLRVTAPVDFAEHVGAVVGRFVREHPRVAVDLRLSNRAVDLVEEGFDVALRVGGTLDGTYVARPLGLVGAVLLASPDYLARHGRPRRPADLTRHRVLLFSEPRSLDHVVLERAGKQVRVPVTAALTTNSGGATRTAMLAGAGIGQLPSFMLDDAAVSGLERVLPEWSYRPGLRLFAVYPHRRFLPAKVRLFVELLRAELGDPTRDPWWPAKGL